MRDTVFMPHRAPEKSYLGKYEQQEGPFIIPRDATHDLLISERVWDVDMKDKKYRTTASGYIRSKREDGSYRDVPMTIEEENDYDTLHKKLSGIYQPTIVEPPVKYALPDTLHVGSDTLSNYYWKTFRYARLPHTERKGEIITTIHKRTLIPEVLRDTVFVTLKLEGTIRIGEEPESTVTISETQPMKPIGMN